MSRHIQECLTVLPTSESSEKHTPGQNQSKLKVLGHQGLRAGLGTSEVDTMGAWMPEVYPSRLGPEAEKREAPSVLETVNLGLRRD